MVEQTDDARIIWSPSTERRKNSHLYRYTQLIEAQLGQRFESYHDLWRWSIENPDAFWQSQWEFLGIIGDRHGKAATVTPNNFLTTRFFADTKLNFTENILAKVPETDSARLIYNVEGETQPGRSGKELHRDIHALALAMVGMRISAGDCVAGYLPNMPETIESCLATAGIGAIWTSTSPDFGVEGTLDRLTQVEPRILVCADHYQYKGKIVSTLDKLDAIIRSLPSLEHVLLVASPDEATTAVWMKQKRNVPITYYENVVQPYRGKRVAWQRFPFNHPLFILYSSGTTGKPKCIVHGAGGTLIQHRKEHVLHCDLKPEDTFFFFTTCGWMMWNWLVSSLASGVRVVLFDGAPFHPDVGVLWRLAEDQSFTLFGTSAKYLSSLARSGYKPGDHHKLSIRTIATTGSPLLPEQFDFVYKHVAADCHLSSISGGTDIISCFVLGVPTLPVRRGEIQGPGLGMAVDVFDPDGQSIAVGRGEMVCRSAFPSKPVRFWNDDRNTKYRAAYFSKGPDCWYQGDYIERRASGGYVIHGRSDTTLNPGGVRIGTAEIYRQIEMFSEIEQSITVGHQSDGDVRVILFVKMAPGYSLDDDLKARICQQLRSRCTHRHVPAKIFAAPDIPVTRTGKISEKAVFDIIHGRASLNLEALANPDSLTFFCNLNLETS